METILEGETEVINVSEEEVIKSLLTKLRKLKLEKDIAIGSLELQLRELQDEIHQKSLPFDNQSQVIETDIKKLIPYITKTIKTDAGIVNYRKGSIRVLYDYKALDAINDEYVKNTILPFRKETQVAPSVSVEVY